jgi:hypothetical protein
MVIANGIEDIQTNPDMSRNIQELINDAYVNGRETVELPAGRFTIRRPIDLGHGPIHLIGAAHNATVLVVSD